MLGVCALRYPLPQLSCLWVLMLLVKAYASQTTRRVPLYCPGAADRVALGSLTRGFLGSALPRANLTN